MAAGPTHPEYELDSLLRRHGSVKDNSVGTREVAADTDDDDDQASTRSSGPSARKSTFAHATAAPAATEPAKHGKADGQAATRDTTLLQRSEASLWLALGFGAFAILSWVITCILVYKTITLDPYHVNTNGYGYDAYTVWYNNRDIYKNSENWFRAMRTIQAILAILIIPVTSAVCGKAAIVFNQRTRAGMTLRHMLVLADKGWASPSTIIGILFRRSYKAYGSRLLIYAMVLHLLGAIIFPLQSLLVTTATIQAPTSPQQVYQVPDLLSVLGVGLTSGTVSNNLVPVRARLALTSTNIADPQARLWPGESVNCSFASDELSDPVCLQGGTNLGLLGNLTDPFLSGLPNGFSTGLIRQFAFRVNSSISRVNIPADEFPSNCDTLPGAFYVKYGYLGTFAESYFSSNWTLEACMPVDQTASPWKPVRERQDFTEVLYLAIQTESQHTVINGTFMITANTTGGYFELPNYMNGNVAGPLLSGNPSELCGQDCLTQGDLQTSSGEWITNSNSNQTLQQRQVTTNYSSTSANKLQVTGSNFGPLLTTTIALFGDGSFIPERLQTPNLDSIADTDANESALGACVSLYPFMQLLVSPQHFFPSGAYGTAGSDCLFNNQAYNVQNELALYASLFMTEWTGPGTITQALNAAMFLANQVWLLSAQNPEFNVNYDSGVSTTIPSASMASIIAISVLLALYLAGLLVLAVYSTRDPLWTEGLDAWAMLRIGATVAEELQPLRVGNFEEVKVLGEIPGWVGDSAEAGPSGVAYKTGHDPVVGSLGLGAAARVSATRRYPRFASEES